MHSLQTSFFLSKEIYKDRKKFSEQVFKVASSDLVNMGISVVSYTLKDVHDDQVIQTPFKSSNCREEGSKVLLLASTTDMYLLHVVTVGLWLKKCCRFVFYTQF